MCESTVEPERAQKEIWYTRISRWVSKATNTRSEYIILIAFQLQQRVHEGVSVLRLFYISCIFEKLSSGN
jgi:hypothetical protein